jgi:hypothetical protein
MDAPRQPVPADFGIAEKDLSDLPQPVFGRPDNVLRKGFWLGIGAPIILCAFIPLYLLVQRDWGNLIVAFLFAPLAVTLGAGLTASVISALGSIENKVRIASSPAFRRASQYRSAVDDYRKKLRDYEQWIAAQGREYWRRQETFWRRLSGVAFENELACLFRRLGYKITQTPRTSDGGVDLILRKDDRITVVQCKAHDKKISIGVARELVASIQDFNAHDAIIACLEGVTKPVQQYIETKPIRVIDVHGILSLQKSIKFGLTDIFGCRAADKVIE